MSDEISVEIFRHLVHLAALDMDEVEAEYLRRELNKQLDSIHELEAIPLDRKMPITSHGTKFTSDISPMPRDDQWKQFSNTQAILDQAPQTGEGYIVVPDIPHKTLK